MINQQVSLVIEEVALDSLRPDPANPRRISEHQLAALARSIEAHGFVQPVLARREDKTVVGGHQRLLAARRLGLTTAPVIWLDVSIEEARLLNLALNRISGDWDEELLARLLSDLAEVPGIDLSLSGFEDEELDQLLNSLVARENRNREEDFDLDEAIDRAALAGRVKSDELWQLGRHRILCGDATKEEDVARLLDGTRAAVAFTDPPYNVALGTHGGQQAGRRKRKIENDNLAPEAWAAFAQDWARNLLSHVDGAIYVCMSSKEWPLVSSVLEQEGAHWSDTMIWMKDRFVLGRADYQRQYEPIWYGWREGVAHHWCGDRDQGDVWSLERPSVSRLHPTMKPLPLIEKALENSSRPGDAVLDLFLGSGSTLLASERTGRRCFGMEIDPVFTAVTILRWEAFTGQRAEQLT